MTSPPRWLSGIALLFWGGLTGHVVIGLIVAIILEARSWLNLRWNFDPKAYVKAWHLCVLCGALIVGVAWINGMKLGKFHQLFIWAPLILLPLELAQRYGTSKKIPLNTLSYFARKKAARDQKQGRPVSPLLIHTSYPYIAIVMLATAMGSHHALYHFLSISFLLAACLWSYSGKKSHRPWAYLCSLLLVLTLSYISQWGILKLYDYYMNRGRDYSSRHTSANESRTSIGKLGKLKLSPRIFWRMQVNHGNVPKLLHTANYNHYANSRWSHKFQPSENRDQLDYLKPSFLAKKQDEDRDIRWFTSNKPDLTQPARLRIIGEIDASVKENPIPLPDHFLAISDLGEKADIESNSLGTVRMANPESSIIEYSLWTGDHSTIEEPQDNYYDLKVPMQERAALQRIAEKLHLLQHNLSTREKIRRIRYFFNTEFTYTTHLNTPRLHHQQRSTAIGQFLETTHSGHCEYFATATTLLLRQTGVPARYCVGFSVHEKDRARDEWVIRGQHAHAWSRVWINGAWEDIDLTPPAWTTLDQPQPNLLADQWQRLREDFQIWRTHAANKLKVFIWSVAIASLLILWITWRLWKSRQRNPQPQRPYSLPKNITPTPLNHLESLVEKKFSPRPQGMPLCLWLENTLPPELLPILRKASALHSIIRFDPLGGTPEQHKELKHLAALLRKKTQR